MKRVEVLLPVALDRSFTYAVPDDIAAVVAFLASGDARWVTGQVLAATGGFTPP